MNTTLQRLARLPAVIGWAGGLGLALLAAALILAARLLVPAYGENNILREEVQRLEGNQASPSAPLPAAEFHQQLEAFLSTLPQQDQINTLLNTLNELASRRHLLLKTGEYRTAGGTTGRISRLQITVKTGGEYRDLRDFLRNAAKALPSVALVRIAVARQKLSDTSLDASLEFALFLRMPES